MSREHGDNVGGPQPHGRYLPPHLRESSTTSSAKYSGRKSPKFGPISISNESNRTPLASYGGSAYVEQTGNGPIYDNRPMRSGYGGGGGDGGGYERPPGNAGYGGRRDDGYRGGGGGFSSRSAAPYGGMMPKEDGRGAGARGYGGGGGGRFDRHDSRVSGGRRGGGVGPGVGIEARDPTLELELFGELKNNTGINFNKYDDIPVEVSGNEVPHPFSSYRELSLHEILADNVSLCGYEVPTPVQKNAITVALARRDLMACAQTGSGKTCAFLLPAVELLMRGELKLKQTERVRIRTAYPLVLVLSPTRELTIQIFNEARKLVYRTGLRPVVVYGGQNVRDQLSQVERGVDILVATPGRLVDFVDRGRISLSCVEYLVFDEADRMLDMGFEPQIRQIVEQSDMPRDYRQTLMFSATFPKEIQRLAADFLRDYVFLAVGRVGSTTDSITQKLEYSDERESNKFDRLMDVLSTAEGLTLIFVETKRAADSLEFALTRQQIEATSIHGDRTQQEREQALAWFRCGRCPVLVATDVASRGLDIPDVRMVINYDLPGNIDDYVHRIGRTGRAGNTGTAISFVSERNRVIVHDLHSLLKENNQKTPDWFERMVRSGVSFGGGHPRRTGGHRQASNFGGRDVRKDSAGVGGGRGPSQRSGGGGIPPPPRTNDSW